MLSSTPRSLPRRHNLIANGKLVAEVANCHNLHSLVMEKSRTDPQFLYRNCYCHRNLLSLHALTHMRNRNLSNLHNPYNLRNLDDHRNWYCHRNLSSLHALIHMRSRNLMSFRNLNLRVPHKANQHLAVEEEEKLRLLMEVVGVVE